MKQFFLAPDNPLLYKNAQAVTSRDITTQETQKEIQLMLEIGYGKQLHKDKPVLVGLAAPQIGILKQVILVDTKADGRGKSGKLEIFINPKIISVSEDESEWYEGCWSAPHVCGIVKRANIVIITAYTETGELMKKTFQDYTARIFQHEIDHLNGILFPDRITNPRNLHLVEDNEFVEYRNKEAWRTWKTLYSRDEWKKMKNIT